MQRLDVLAQPRQAGAARTWARWDEVLAALALALMLLVPLVEIATRPFLGRGVQNAAAVVQHLGLVLAMFGALAAARYGQLTTLGSSIGQTGDALGHMLVRAWAAASASLVCGLLAWASWQFVATEIEAGQSLAYGLPLWVLQAALPLGFALLGWQLGLQAARQLRQTPLAMCVLAGGLLPAMGVALAWQYDGYLLPSAPALVAVVLALLAGAPVFAVLGGLALALFWSEGLPLASVALSHYQITVNPSLPALPLFTLAGLVLARTGAAQRLGAVFVALFGSGQRGTVVAVAALCSGFTALTGGSGVTILALGGLLVPMLLKAGYEERRGIGLVTSASALGVLLAPSVPLIMYAVIARVPIEQMFLAGIIPAVVMVACLLVIGGFLRRSGAAVPDAAAARPSLRGTLAAAWAAKWELAAPVVAIGSLASGVATPTESAALTAAYAVLTQSLAHRELGLPKLGRCLADCAMLIGGVMLILGMALALTNFLIDTGLPDAAADWVQGVIPNRVVFLILLCLFLCLAAAMMEIYAAIVVLVPLLLPVALAYGIDPVHFGIIFLAAMEVGYLCPPAGLNIYFASAMFKKSIRYVGISVLPAMAAILAGTIIIALVPELSTGLPRLLGVR